MPNRLIIPTAPHTLDCFNTAATPYSNGASAFYLAPSDTINSLFVAGLYSYIYKACTPYDDTTFIINAESLRDFLGFSRGGRSKDIKQELHQLNNESCFIKGQQFPLAAVRTDGRLTLIHSDYIHRLTVAIKDNAIRPDHTEGSRYTSLVHADIVRMRNQPSAEVCIELCKLIERRGSYNTAPVHVAVKTLIRRCPSLRHELTAATTNSRRNQLLRYALTKGAQLLTTHTSTYEEYTDLSVSLPATISLATGTDLITATHKGKQY